MTNQYREGADEWILFTELEYTADDNIKIGDYIVADNVNYLVYEEYNHPQKSLYLKHRVIECNIQFKQDNIVQYATYMGSLRSNMDLMIKNTGGAELLVDSLKPMIIAANNDSIKVRSRVMITTKDALEVTQIDRISNQGIMYMSVKDSPINSYYDDLVEGAAKTTPIPVATLPAQYVEAGVEKTVSTNFAYAIFSADVEVTSKTLTSVTFVCPYGIDELTVTTKDGAGDEVETTYEVI